MAKSAGKTIRKKGARTSPAAKRKPRQQVSKAAKKTSAKKKTAKKSASAKKGKIKASTKKAIPKKQGAKKAPAKKTKKTAARKSPTKKAGLKTSVSRPQTGVAAKPLAKTRVSATYLRPNGEALPLAQRLAKPGRRARKTNLHQRARPLIGRSHHVSGLAQPNTNWLAPDEPASDTALRDRILVCLLALEGRLAGREPEPGALEWPKIVGCYQQIWDWISQSVTLKDGRPLSGLLFEALLADELAMLRENLTSPVFDARPFDQARSRLTLLCLSPQRPSEPNL